MADEDRKLDPYAQTGTVDTTQGTPNLREVSPFLDSVLPAEETSSEEEPKEEPKEEAEEKPQAASARKGRQASVKQDEKSGSESDEK